VKVLLLNTSDLDGGAARAAYRLHQGLVKAGVNSQMLVQKKIGNHPTIVGPISKIQKGLATIKPSLDIVPQMLYQKRDRPRNYYSPQWLPDKIAPKIEQINPDVINIHWINGGYIQIETIGKFKKPIVWTLHDMWAFTGGCHYTQDCDRYKKSCGSCPQLSSNSNWDLSRWVWQRKKRAWKNVNLIVVTPSKWLAECAKSSSLFSNLKIEVIPNGLDINKYKPIDKKIARNILGLSLDKKIILFGAINSTSSPRKGFNLLQNALQKLSQEQEQNKFELVIFGASEPAISPNFGFKTHYLDKLYDDISLYLIYSAADVFVLPSRQDNLPNTVMEALSCGTPCVGFNIGGMPELIEHQHNGYLAEPFNVFDLAKGISWVIENIERYCQLSLYARQKVEQEFNLEIQATKYTQLFQRILSTTG
jgi:glycosyltransferase involved in cell wall biosynthesis